MVYSASGAPPSKKRSRNTPRRLAQRLPEGAHEARPARRHVVENAQRDQHRAVRRDGAAAAVREATAQLRRYLADERLPRAFPSVRFIGLAVVFHGWELVRCDAVHGPPA